MTCYLYSLCLHNYSWAYVIIVMSLFDQSCDSIPAWFFPRGFFTRELFRAPSWIFASTPLPFSSWSSQQHRLRAPQFYRGRDFSFKITWKLICCVLIFIGLLTVFDLPAVVKLHKSFRIKRDYSFKPLPLFCTSFISVRLSLSLHMPRALSIFFLARPAVARRPTLTTSSPGDSPSRHR